MEDRAPAGRAQTGRALAAAVLLAAIALVAYASWASAVPGPTDLSLTKSDSADPVTQGSNFTYTVQISNQGANDATGVVVTDQLPGRVDFISASASSGSCDRQGNEVTCELGTVLSGASASVSIVVKAKRHGTASNTASVTTTVADTGATNNQDTETTRINKKAKAPKKKKAKGLSCASPTIVGTPGNDVLVGTARGDAILALSGDDRIFAGGGKDLVCANKGNDLVRGGGKADRLKGGPGRDKLIGNAGDDVLKGKGGRDRLRGKGGNDFLNGGKKRDNCKGGAGRDVLRSCP